MDGNEVARNQLDVLLNDVDARSIFGKSDPLNWFSPINTTKGLLKRGFLTEKQVELISKVFEQYSKLKKVSKKFISSGEGRDLANLLDRFLQDKPKNISTEDRGRSQKFSKIIHSFSEGTIVHVGLFNDAESLICEFPTEIKNRILALEWVHSARRKYLMELMQCKEKVLMRNTNHGLVFSVVLSSSPSRYPLYARRQKQRSLARWTRKWMV